MNTLLEMMEEMPFDSIVISTLVSRAGVGRASFYRNYTDKEDILRIESDRLIREWGGVFNKEDMDNHSEVLISLLNFIKEHQTFYTALYHDGKSNILQDTILSLFPVNKELSNVLAYLYSAVGYTIYGWVHEWINRGMKESGTELAKMIEQSTSNKVGF